MIAITNFRTMANGSYRYMAGKRRGYWRVLVVRDVNGPTMVTSKNVVRVAYEGPNGIDGVTERSAYYLGSSAAHASDIADRLNAERFAACVMANAFKFQLQKPE